MSDKKSYLGDGVYADIDQCDGTLILTTENGISVENTIYLDSSVWRTLLLFVQRNSESSKIQDPHDIQTEQQVMEALKMAPAIGAVAVEEPEDNPTISAVELLNAPRSVRQYVFLMLRQAMKSRDQLAAAERERDALLACRHGDQRCFECPDVKCCDNLNEAAKAAGGGE